MNTMGSLWTYSLVFMPDVWCMELGSMPCLRQKYPEHGVA